MADSIVTTSSNLAGVTEHSFNRRVHGDIASVRQRMIEALERFNYVVLSEDPLHAKRDGAFSMNVLDCALKLTIFFRQSSTNSTTATFNYIIPLSMVTKGDLHTVEREADALIALVTKGETANACLSCGTINLSDSRFCRGCGTPNAGGLPAEFEVMRLTAGARAGQQTIVTGVIVMLSILTFALPLILLGRPSREIIGWVLLMLGEFTGWAILLYGIFRLHRTLNPKANTPAISSMGVPRINSTVEPAALPPRSAWSSVTEGTTELLGAQPQDRRATPVDRTSADTGAIK